MTLEQAVSGWVTLTQSEARRLIGAANAVEQAAAKHWERQTDGTPEESAAKAAWDRAFALWENLRVFAICGEKVADPCRSYGGKESSQ